ncbi:MAG: ABC transporter ATP-binding protein [Bacillota bacterium]
MSTGLPLGLGVAGGKETPLLEVRGLKKYFPIRTGVLRRVTGWVRAVDGVSLTVRRRGESLGIVGESGCGKSTLARTILRLVEPTGGSVVFDGHDITSLRGEDLRRMRRHMQIVFQDPYWSLDPRLRVMDIVAEPLRAHMRLSCRELRRRVEELCALVGLPAEFLSRYPHEMSGGQRQRVGVARALALDPSLVVLDEPTSSLDVSVQAQVLNLLSDLQARLGLSYLLISHDIGVVEHMCDNVGVMYLGVMVETGPVEKVLGRPLHPYTGALINAVPAPDPKKRSLGAPLEGDVPDPSAPPPGCRFWTRCPHARDICRAEVPALRPVEPGHEVACHLA